VVEILAVHHLTVIVFTALLVLRVVIGVTLDGCVIRTRVRSLFGGFRRFLRAFRLRIVGNDGLSSVANSSISASRDAYGASIGANRASRARTDDGFASVAAALRLGGMSRARASSRSEVCALEATRRANKVGSNFNINVIASTASRLAR
jgi:hypothetical protein